MSLALSFNFSYNLEHVSFNPNPRILNCDISPLWVFYLRVMCSRDKYLFTFRRKEINGKSFNENKKAVCFRSVEKCRPKKHEHVVRRDKLSPHDICSSSKNMCVCESGSMRWKCCYLSFWVAFLKLESMESRFICKFVKLCYSCFF